MTRSDLLQMVGSTVQVELDGQDALSELQTDEMGNPVICWPAGLVPNWTSGSHIPLSSEDIAKMRPNGLGNIFSMIRLQSRR